MPEFVGFKDKHGHKLYVGDRVKADNGVIGRVVTYDSVEQNVNGDITHTKKYRINWSPDGWVNDNFSNFIQQYITKAKKGK